MLMTIFTFAGLFYLLRYYELTAIIVLLISQPLWVYATIAISALALKIGYSLYKLYPRVRRLYRSLISWSDRSDPFGPTSVAKPNSGINFIQKRKFSTSTPRGSSRYAGLRDNKKSLYHSTLLRLNFSLDNIHESFTVKGGRPAMNPLIGISLFAGAKRSIGLIKFVVLFIYRVKNLIRTQGVKGATKYLKVAAISLQQSLGGHNVKNMNLLGCRISKNGKGIPRILPNQIRMLIRAGNPVTIRLALTLLNVYRVFSYTGQLKLSTITSPFTGTDGLKRYLYSVIPLFIKRFVLDRYSLEYLREKFSEYARRSAFAIFKGGPGVKGVLGEFNTYPPIMIRAGIALRMSPHLWESFALFLGSFQYPKILHGLSVVNNLISLQVKPEVHSPLLKPLPYLGKLGTKVEAAGKVRVFAMVDAWTQWILYPLHKVLFLILSKIRMDGTFDQSRPLWLINRNRGTWSLDLSAATDRLPVTLQKDLLSGLFGHELAGAWLNLLVNRVYMLGGRKPQYLRYSVGQPMGALSSWAMLAFTHHFIVQAAAWRAGFPKWKLFTNYAVLGDDVVIGDYRVMTQYLQIMDSLGVECGLHKSLMSPSGTAMEFAKKTIFKGVDVSPVAFKEFFAATRNIGALREMSVKFQIPFHRVLDALGVGWKVRSWLNKPIGKLGARIRLLVLAFNLPQTEEEVTKFFTLGKSPTPQYNADVKLIINDFVSKEIERLIGKVMNFSNDVVKHDSSSAAKEWARSVLAEAHNMTVESFLAWGKGNSHLLYLRKQLSFAYEGMLGLFWVEEQNSLVSQSQTLLKQLWDVRKDTFENLYIDWLVLSREISSLSHHTFSLVRSNPAEIKGVLTPSQVRMWKRWSSVLQGTKPVHTASDTSFRLKNSLYFNPPQANAKGGSWRIKL
nr:MAG: RNA-dependent RNA polymerase [Rhizoctonia solani mitovirus 47]